MDITALPREIFSGSIPKCGHVQGIATDGTYMYFSFTTLLLKTDMTGKIIGSATGLTGHLGCIAWSDTDKRVYGSLEFKNDAIGRGILRSLGKEEENPDAFYIARFDVEKITEPGMDALDCGIMTMVKLADAVEDYGWTDGKLTHRHGCSGIDGITIVPDFGGRRSIFVAYGVYGDTERDDNDNQVLLRYDFDAISAQFARILPSDPGEGIRAAEKLFVYTGNTTYGVQNLEYDPHTSCILAAVYRGKKPQFPNRAMYFIDMAKPAVTRDGVTYLQLADRGEKHESGIRGSEFPLGATGMISLGGGYYYFSQSGRTAENEQWSRVILHKLDGDSNFLPV